MLRKLWFNLAYLKKPIWDTGVSPQELLDFITSHAPGRALDLGCGTGTNVVTLAKHGWQVTGVDFSRRAILAAQRKAHENQVEVDLRIADVTRLDERTGSFDLILDMGCYHTLPHDKRPAYIHNVDRLLADAGTFMLYTFIKSSLDVVGPGTTDAEIRFISQELQVVERKDSTERGLRPSAWLTIKKRIANMPGQVK